MARISNYTIDTTVESSDKFIGSNSGGSTKNFKVSDISKHLRATNAAGVGGQLVYIYDQGSFSDDTARQAGKINFGVGGSGPVNFSDITGLKINKLTSGNDHSVENFIPSFNNTKNISLAVNNNSGNVSININMEINNWYQTPHQIEFSNYGMGIMMDMTTQMDIQMNGSTDVFSVTIEK